MATESEQENRFRQLPRDHQRLDALDLYARVVDRTGLPLKDPAQITGALDDLRRNLVNVTDSESTLHGWRIQALFEAVIASLGRVQLLKQEDVGDVFLSGPTIAVPDYRVITEHGEQMLVEVKNHHRNNPESPYRVRVTDLEALREYAELVGVGTLTFAIYWSRWNLWTLTSDQLFEPDPPNHVSISLPDALKGNRMGSVGDRMPATEWPIGLTFRTDPEKPRTIDPDGKAEFTIGGVEFTVAGRVVSSSTEQQILFRLMMHGGWSEEAPVEVIDNEVISFSFLYSPEEPPPPSQGFAMHGPLSSIYSALFNNSTTTESGEVTALRLDIDPGSLATLIPDDYDGEVLKIWRFRQEPSE